MGLGGAIAAAQFAPVQGDLSHNIGIALQISFEAALAGAKLVVLPELCVSGPDIFGVKEASRAAQSSMGWQTREFQNIASSAGIYILFGYVEAAEGNFYNSCALVGPDGSVHNFRKRNLWSSDFFWATASTDEQGEIAVTPLGRIGALICRDVQNRDRRSTGGAGQPYYTRGSVDIVCVPANWSTAAEFPHHEWVELAEEVRATVVVANRCPALEDPHVGGSCIISPTLEVIVGDQHTACIVGAFL